MYLKWYSIVLVSTVICGSILLCLGQDGKFWNDKGFQDIKEAKKVIPIVKRAKNVVFFLGDGMGISTLTTARVFKGEFEGGGGESRPLSFEKWPHVGLSMTYNTDKLVADSAGTATAFLTGVKTRFGLVGVDSQVDRRNCSSYRQSSDAVSFLRLAAQQGKSVGLVTTTRITHATPAAAYAHSAERNWESDTDRDSQVPLNLRTRCRDIASQMVTNAIDFRVILGGGRSKFLLQTQRDSDGEKGSRDDENLIAKWKKIQKQKGRRYRYIENGTDLRSLESDKTDYLLGLFASSHMEYEYTRRQNGRKQPSLKEMTSKALEILKRNEKGYVLFVEAGRIDHAHHDSQAFLALFDTLAMDEATAHAESVVDKDETLMIATGDHSHVFTIGGYTSRGHPILNVTDYNFGFGPGNGKDGKPFTTLLYANGPTGPNNAVRPDLTGVNLQSPTYAQQALVPLNLETHAGEDVSIYAQGPMAHMIGGLHEQNYLAHVVMYSQCSGPYTHEAHCLNSSPRSVFPIMSLVIIFAFLGGIDNWL